MGADSDGFSLRRTRVLTVAVLIVVAAAIASANGSTALVTVELLDDVAYNKKTPERALGWPFTWYWRSAQLALAPAAGPVRQSLLEWQLARYSASALAANLAIWLALLAVTYSACRRLLRCFWPPAIRMPRAATLVVLTMVAVFTILANLSFDMHPKGQQRSYGWPFLWRRHMEIGTWSGGAIQARDYDPGRLAGNVAIWLAMLAAAGVVCEWLLRRFRPRFRWSLRTMFGSVGLAAAFCAWCVALRNRADEQDALAEWKYASFHFERWGPKWLDVVGAERYHRRIVGADVRMGYYADRANSDEELFQRVARLPGLRTLHFCPYTDRWPDGFTSNMVATLGEMRQLRALNFESSEIHDGATQAATRECLAAIGELTGLRRLRLSIGEENRGDLASLSGLTNVTALALEITPLDDHNDEGEASAGDRVPGLLARLPQLPRLEELDLGETALGVGDIARLAGLPRLKRLNLSQASISDKGLAELARLESLEELAINEDMATAAGFEALAALKRLKAVHIGDAPYGPMNPTITDRAMRRAELAGYDEGEIEAVNPVTLAQDDGYELVVLPDEDEGVRRALETLRVSNPEVVIDGRNAEFQESLYGETPRLDGEGIWLMTP